MEEKPKIIDTHVHFFDKRDATSDLEWSWLAAGADHPIRGNIDPIKAIRFDIDSVDAESRFAGVEGFVHIQSATGLKDPVLETLWLEKMRLKSHIPFQIVGNVDLASLNAVDQLERHLSASKHFVGVRDRSIKYGLMAGDTSTYSPALAFMARQNLVLDFLCEYPNMLGGRKLAESNPNLTLVLEHVGFPRSRDFEYFRNWSLSLSELCQAPNVVCKVSGLGMTDPRFDAKSLEPWMQHCLDSFGPARLIIGSNWPIDRLYSSYDSIMKIYRDFFSELSRDEQELIFNRNARQIYSF